MTNEFWFVTMILKVIHPQMENPSLKTTSVYGLDHHIRRDKQRSIATDAKLTEVTLSQASHFFSLKERERTNRVWQTLKGVRHIAEPIQLPEVWKEVTLTPRL